MPTIAEGFSELGGVLGHAFGSDDILPSPGAGLAFFGSRSCDNAYTELKALRHMDLGSLYSNLHSFYH